MSVYYAQKSHLAAVGAYAYDVEDLESYSPVPGALGGACWREKPRIERDEEYGWRCEAVVGGVRGRVRGDRFLTVG